MLAQELTTKIRDINNQINKLEYEKMLLQHQCPHDWKITETLYNGKTLREFQDDSMEGIGCVVSETYKKKCNICGCTSFN
jgi:hypothetical protein